MKVAITGTTSGIGQATTALLNSTGYKVFEINRLNYDLADLNKINETIDLSDCDVLINNAGYNPGKWSTLDAPFPDWVNIYNVNQLAPILLTQKFIQSNKQGTIIYLTNQFTPSSNCGGPYQSAKAALSWWIESMRQETKDYRFVDVSIGRVRTNMRRQWGKDLPEEYLNFQGPDALTTIDAEDVAIQIKHIIEHPHVGNITISHQRR